VEDDCGVPETPSERKRREAKEKRKAENRKKLELARKKGEEGVSRMPIGTPVGNKQRLQAFKEKLLTDHNGTNVIRKTLEIAMDDDHPGQMAALKLCMDRMLPTSMFDESKRNEGRTAIQINIRGINDPEIQTVEGDVLGPDEDSE